MSKIFKLFGIILILLIYLISSINKIFKFNETVDKIKNKFIFNKLPKIISIIAIGIVVFFWTIGSMLLIYSVYKKHKKLGIIISSITALLTFIITFYFHSPFEKGQEIQFLKNMAIIGGFILLIGDFFEI